MRERELNDHSVAELVRRASEQVNTLVRDEIQLARAELSAKGKRVGKGAGLFGGAGLAALYAIGALIAAATLALDLVMPAWAAALIVGVVLLLAAGVLALIGRDQLQKARPPMPEESAQSLRADVGAVTTAVGDRHKP